MAKKVERSFDRDRVGLDLEQLVSRFELLVELSRRVGVALSESANHGLDPRPRDVRVHTNTADAAELEEVRAAAAKARFVWLSNGISTDALSRSFG